MRYAGPYIHAACLPPILFTSFGRSRRAIRRGCGPQAGWPFAGKAGSHSHARGVRFTMSRRPVLLTYLIRRTKRPSDRVCVEVVISHQVSIDKHRPFVDDRTLSPFKTPFVLARFVSVEAIWHTNRELACGRKTATIARKQDLHIVDHELETVTFQLSSPLYSGRYPVDYKQPVSPYTISLEL